MERIALIAHDRKKDDLVDFIFNPSRLWTRK